MVAIQARIPGAPFVSNTILFGYTAAMVATASPLRDTSVGGAVLTVSGTNFGRALSGVTTSGCLATNRVTVGTFECAVLQVCVLPCSRAHWLDALGA
jgi:hypothetical protein